MTSKMTAADKRHVAIAAMSEAFIPAPKYLLKDTTKEEVKEAIELLRPLGRTDRWSKALDGWQKMVEDYDDLRWVILQGAIGAGYAAM